jgi:hypothetical protein
MSVSVAVQEVPVVVATAWRGLLKAQIIKCKNSTNYDGTLEEPEPGQCPHTVHHRLLTKRTAQRVEVASMEIP